MNAARLFPLGASLVLTRTDELSLVESIPTPATWAIRPGSCGRLALPAAGDVDDER